jgi:cellulose synthase/poly-beta-1,6-N-acetylglucosamine synthase-like glycosyltransferase
MPTKSPVATPTDAAPWWPGVTVIVAARDAAATLPACLASLRALAYPLVEVIVVDDGSRDDTAAVAQAGGARLLDAGGRGPSIARNYGVSESSHEIVAFTDADCVVPRHWLKALVEGLRTSQAAGAGGPQRNVFPVDASADARDLDAFFSLASVVAEYTRADDKGREVDHNASCNVAYVRHAFREVGGFADGLWPGEDVDLDFRLRRLGYRCHYVPDAWVEHHRPGTATWFASMMRRYGRAQRELVERHGRFRPLHYLPGALVALAVAQALALSPRTRLLAIAIDGTLLAGAAVVLASRVPARQWPAVIRYAAIALTEWHRGYAEGLRNPARQ